MTFRTFRRKRYKRLQILFFYKSNDLIFQWISAVFTPELKTKYIFLSRAAFALYLVFNLVRFD